MSINYYKVLQSVLSQTRDVICRTYDISRDDAFIKSELFIKKNSEQWRLPNPDIQYEDPFCRIAYLYMNVVIHANLMEIGLDSFHELRNLIRELITKGEEVRFCALGGGPGSELLGLVKFIQSKNYKHTSYLDFTLVDRVREWDESWHSLKIGVDEQLKEEYGTDRSKWASVISRSFLPLDVTKPEDFQDFATRFNGNNIFICCYLVSEIKGSIDKFEKTLNLLTARASEGAFILFIDRNERKVRETIQHLIEVNPQLTMIRSFQERGKLEKDFQNLGEWYINIPSLPRQTWLTYFALAKKTSDK